MPNLLFLSENEAFKEDILGQIKIYAPDFATVVNDEDADLIIVDDNVAFLDTIKSDIDNKPLIYLTSRDDICVEAYQVINKPFALDTFIDVIKSAINTFENSKEGSLEFNNYILYPAAKEIVNLRNDKVTKLTEKEVAIIKYLYKNKDKIIGKNDLMQEVWGYAADVATHTVETHIYRLRQKVECDDLSAQLILTSIGGYQLKV